jgi:hypothetical protein
MNKIAKKILLSVLIGILFSTLTIGSAVADQKNIKATINPDSVSAYVEEEFALTITNDPTTSSGNKLGSAIITLPPEFGIPHKVSVVTSEGKSWNYQIDSANNKININALKPTDSISPTQSVTTIFTSKTPAVNGDYPIIIVAYTKPTYAGDLFNPNVLVLNIKVSLSFWLEFPSGFNPGTITIGTSLNPVDLDLYSLGEVYSPYFTVSIENNQLTGKVTLIIGYDDEGLTPEQEQNLRLYMSDPVDFNGDGTVNGNDVNMLIEAIHVNDDSQKYDINHDGDVNIIDLNIVKDYANGGLLVPASNNGQWRLPWLDITIDIDTEKNLIYGATDHFSGFGVR